MLISQQGDPDFVKVLDFGLSKAFAGEESGGSLSPLTQSPTAAVGTVAGVLLGTAAYMAPAAIRDDSRISSIVSADWTCGPSYRSGARRST